MQLIAWNENTGFVRGNNLAVKTVSTKSEWIALLNPDAFAEPRWLEDLLAATKRNPEFDVFGSKLVNAANPTVLDSAGDAYHMSGLAWNMGHGLPLSEAEESEREVFSPCVAAALYRCSCLAESRWV